ncbi:MAG: AAA family ATPase [Schleiferiaceae bacterium]|nr:AAA family ATPase [Schleiferiaceae bacterium]
MPAASQHLDASNKVFFTAAKYVEDTNQSVFLTGRAGTGKTTFLKHIAETSSKKVVVLAPTGIAALNAGGQTIHSFFRLPITPFLPIDRALLTPSEIRRYLLDAEGSNIYKTFRYNARQIELLHQVDCFVIDEISMVRCDVLDAIDKILRTFLNRPDAPFGGKQMVFVGDPYQLPPVVNAEQEALLSRCYSSFYFFDAKSFIRLREQGKLCTFSLEKIYRQKDTDFLHILNNVRENNLDWGSQRLLNSRYIKGFKMPSEGGWIELTAKNSEADYSNKQKLAALPGKEHCYKAKSAGEINLNQVPCEIDLRLKVGAQVVFLKNDTQGHQRYVNGTIGTISALTEKSIVVETEKCKVEIGPEVWENVRYNWNDSKREMDREVVGEVRQFPIKLAWAITIHKSQGLTLDRVVANLRSCFAPGQVYVALSRCTSLEGLVLTTPIDSRRVQVRPEVLRFVADLDQLDYLESQLAHKEVDFLYESALQALLKSDFTKALQCFEAALEKRAEWSHPLQYRAIRVFCYRIFTNYIRLHRMASISTKQAQKSAENCATRLEQFVAQEPDVRTALRACIVEAIPELAKSLDA